MPLTDFSLKLVNRVFDEIEGTDLPRRVLCLSNPDVIASPTVVASIFRRPDGSPKITRELNIRHDSDRIIGWHKARKITTEVVDTVDMFDALGYRMTSVDITEARGGEVKHDLNEPLPAEFRDGYSLVYDCISNQVFNIAEAIRSAATACCVGGYVLHTIPINTVNQGFWSVSPCAWFDFYGANGFEIAHYRASADLYVERVVIEPAQPVHRMRGLPDDSISVVLAKKKEKVEIKWPVMTKFKMHPMSHRE